MSGTERTDPEGSQPDRGASTGAPQTGACRWAVPKWLVVVATLIAAVVVLASGSRIWVHGTVHDAVLSDSQVDVTGSQAASGVVAAALVGAAAVLAAITGGRIIRRVGAIALALAGVLVVVLALRVQLDPSSIVGEQAATRTGRTGSVDADGTARIWVMIVLLAGLAMTFTGIVTLLSVRAWGGLSSRYESPAAEQETDRATDAESAWERLSRGEDPT